MTPGPLIPVTPRLEEAIVELRELIARHYPDATFTVSEGEDPDGIYLTATVDVEDMGEVVDIFLDRMVDLQVEEGLPIFVVAVRPLGRNLAILARQHAPSALLSHSYSPPPQSHYGTTAGRHLMRSSPSSELDIRSH